MTNAVHKHTIRLTLLVGSESHSFPATLSYTKHARINGTREPHGEVVVPPVPTHVEYLGLACMGYDIPLEVLSPEQLDSIQDEIVNAN